MGRTVKSEIGRAADSGIKVLRQYKCYTHIKKSHPNLKRERAAYWTYKMYNLLYKKTLS